VVEIAGHHNTAICGIDLKRVELSGWRPCFTTLATNPDTATQLLSNIQQLVDYRSGLLESLGLRKWDLKLGPAVFFVIDELAELLAIDNKSIADALNDPDNTRKTISTAKNIATVRIDMLASLTRLARFAGVTIVCATQYPLANIVPSELRSNLTFDKHTRCRAHYPTDEQITARANQTAHLQIPANQLFHYPPIVNNQAA